MTSSGRKKFLAPELLAEATAEIGSIAKHEGVPVALIGGFAMQVYGSDRLTGDVDIAAAARLKGLRHGKALSFGGEQTKAPNGVPVDLVLRNDDYADLYEEAIGKAVRIRGIAIEVARPEHLAAMKMVAGRSRDTVDLEFLIASGAVVPARARKVIREHLGIYAADELDRTVEQIKWMKSRGKL